MAHSLKNEAEGLNLLYSTRAKMALSRRMDQNKHNEPRYRTFNASFQNHPKGQSWYELQSESAQSSPLHLLQQFQTR